MDRDFEQLQSMKRSAAFACLAGCVVLILLALALGGCAPTAEEEQSERDEHRRKMEEHLPTPENWARCQSVCGEHAALLPAGDGSWWVNCSCLPVGSAAPGVR